MSAKLNRYSALCASFPRGVTGLTGPNNRSEMNGRIVPTDLTDPSVRTARNVKTGPIVRRVPNVRRAPSGRPCRNALRNARNGPNVQNLRSQFNRRKARSRSRTIDLLGSAPGSGFSKWWHGRHARQIRRRAGFRQRSPAADYPREPEPVHITRRFRARRPKRQAGGLCYPDYSTRSQVMFD